VTESWYQVIPDEREFALFTETVAKHGSPFPIRRPVDNVPCPVCGQPACIPEELHRARTEAADSHQQLVCVIGGSDHSEHRCQPATNSTGIIA
jgi:hypothetical protein